MNRTYHSRVGEPCSSDAPSFRHYCHAQNYIWKLARRMASEAQACADPGERHMAAAAAFSLLDTYARMMDADSERRAEAITLRDTMACLALAA